MKKIIITIIFFFAITSYSQEKIVPNPIAIELARSFTKDIFDLNGTDIVEPSVRVINSVSNDRFYQSAYIPYKENKFYVRVELNGMYGSVPNDMKTFTPEIPQEKYNNDSLISYMNIGFEGNQIKYSIRDTAKLVSYIFKTLLYDGINKPNGHSDRIQIPTKASY